MNFINNGPWSSTASITVPQKLAKVTNFNTRNEQGNLTAYSWDAVANAVRYEVQRRPSDLSGPFTGATVTFLAEGFSTTTSTDSHQWRVRACDSNNFCGDWSRGLDKGQLSSKGPVTNASVSVNADGNVVVDFGSLRSNINYRISRCDSDCDFDDPDTNTFVEFPKSYRRGEHALWQPTILYLPHIDETAITTTSQIYNYLWRIRTNTNLFDLNNIESVPGPPAYIYFAKPTGITLTVDNQVVNEVGEKTVTVRAQVEGTPYLLDQTVALSVSGAGVAGSVDFAAVSDFNMVIPANETIATATFTLNPVDDEILETTETITVAGTVVGTAANFVTPATFELTDNDPTTLTFTVDTDPSTTSLQSIINESNGTQQILVTVTANSYSGVARVIELQFGGTSTLGIDYIIPKVAVVVIHAGSTKGSTLLDLGLIRDRNIEDGETIIISGTPESAEGLTLTPAAPINILDGILPPIFTNAANFATPITVVENTATTTSVGGTDFFATTGSGTVNLMLGGTDGARFAITSDGTLTFNDPPDFEMPRGMALSGTNTNDYALTVTAMNSVGSAASGAITVTVTDENEAPVLDAIPMPTFTEYSEGTFTITATDEDAGQMLTFTLTGEAHGATIATGGGFNWTPGEDDGGVERMFTVTVTDSGTPPMRATGAFNIIAMELPNRAPTGAVITAATTVTVPNTLTLEAAATDPDTGDVLTYTWAITTTDGGTIAPMTGASVTYTPAAVTSITTVTVTVTVSDAATPPLTTTATHTITVNPPVAAGTAPAFTNMAMFTTAIEVAENQTAVGAPNFFVAPGSAPVNLMLGGTDASFFAITNDGTLTFNDPPNFEMPRGMALSGTNTNDYALTVTATNSTGSAASGAITVTVTDENEAPVLDAIPMPGFTEHTAGGFTITATDVDDGQMLTFTLTGEAHGATIASTGEFNWTPGEADGVARMFTVTVTDNGTPMMMARTTFSITVEADTAPAFASDASIPDQSYIINQKIEPLTLPEATGGNGAITYTLTPAIPGLSLDSSTGVGVLSGTPTTAAPAVMYTYTAADGDGNMAADDAATLTFSITVTAAGVDIAPTFGGATIDDQSYTQGTEITSLTLPAATGGNGTITYTLTPPAGLTFNAATRELTGTPTTVAGATDYTYTATDADDNNAADDTATLTFSITVTAAGVDIAPTFGGATIPDQSYTQGTEITSLTLPAATGGNGAITYTLTPAIPGLSLDSSTGVGVLSGTPTTAAATAMYTYTATDADDNNAADDTATLTFTITVSPMVTGIDDFTDRTFNIYPNPVSGSLTVERKGIAGDEISIHDFTGKRIQVPVREQSPGKVVLDVSGLAGGMYLVRVSGNVSSVIIR